MEMRETLYARSVYSPSGYGQALGHRPVHDLQESQRDDWDREVAEIASALPEWPCAPPRARPRVDVDRATGQPIFAHGPKPRCQAQVEAMLVQKFEQRDSRVFSPGTAGDLQRAIDVVIKAMHGRRVSPRDYVALILQMGFARRGELVTFHLNACGGVTDGRLKFPDGSEAWFDETGIR